jgi:hypothetical protein
MNVNPQRQQLHEQRFPVSGNFCFWVVQFVLCHYYFALRSPVLRVLVRELVPRSDGFGDWGTFFTLSAGFRSICHRQLSCASLIRSVHRNEVLNMRAIAGQTIFSDDALEFRMLLANRLQKASNSIAFAVVFVVAILLDDGLNRDWNNFLSIRMH